MQQYRDERSRIVRATFELVGRGPETRPVSVNDILQATGLSTRAFYRHFSSKDELLVSMYRTSAERLAGELSAAVAEAPDAASALVAWVRQYLAVVFDPRRQRQTSALSSAEARAVAGFDEVHQQLGTVHRTILAEVLRQGQRTGAFPHVGDADEDARAVHSVVTGLIDARLAGTSTPDWAEATEHTADLFLRAFGSVPARPES